MLFLMETIITVVGGVALALAVFGGALSAVFLAYGGIQWMVAAGDPQKMAQARGGVIGAVVGLIIVGVSFLIPPVVSELVIEPAGGVAIESLNSFDCDGMLRSQLVSRRWANNPERMQRIITQVQVQQKECDSERWSPVVETSSGFVDCYGGTLEEELAMGGVLVPRGLKDFGIAGHRSEISKRDAENNILVYWDGSMDKRPADGAHCWMYVSAFGSWREFY